MTKDEREYKKKVIEENQDRADECVRKLLYIVDDLKDVGAIRKAKSLETIIDKLERWQNT